MFRTISLVRVTEDADAAAIVGEMRRIYEAEPQISQVTVALGRRLLDPQWPQASYSIEMEFATEDDWRKFRESPSHEAIHHLTAGKVESMMTTQYDG